MNQKKILVMMPTGHLMGGGMFAGLQLVEVLKGQKLNVVVILGNDSNSFATALDNMGIVNYSMQFDWWIRGNGNDYRGNNFYNEMPDNIDTMKAITDIIKNEKPDVALTHTIDIPWLAYAAHLCGVPHIWSIHEVINHETWITRLQPEEHFRIVDELSCAVIANSKYTRSSITPYFVNNTAIQVVPPLYLSEKDIASKTKNKPRFDENSFNIVLVGNFNPLKHQLDAVKAIHELQKKDLHPTLYLVGYHGDVNDREYNDVITYIDKNSLKDQVVITGHKENALAYIQAADLLLMCSDNESFGMVTIEAMALGTPVVGAKAAGTKEIINNNKYGYFYESGNVNDMARLIRHVRDNYEEAMEKARVAKEFVWQKYTKDNNYLPLFSAISNITKVEHERTVSSAVDILDVVLHARLSSIDSAIQTFIYRKELWQTTHSFLGLPVRIGGYIKRKAIMLVRRVRGNVDAQGLAPNGNSRLHKKISIVVPVYADWETLSLNIASLIDEVGGKKDVDVWYVNDCGPEADYLEDKINEAIGDMKNFYYYRNVKNLGFVQNCNNAVFDLVDNNSNVLLLNSDTKVTKGFLKELDRVLYSGKKIGVVSPRSNNATQWSVPMGGQLASSPGVSFYMWERMKPLLPEMYICPTAHGFCMLIKRELIDKYGLFDEIYGAGYAEETDFTMRIRKHGYLCATANHAFVFHYESKSFGSERRNKLIEKNRKIIIKRYPDVFKLMEAYEKNIIEPTI